MIAQILAARHRGGRSPSHSAGDGLMRGLALKLAVHGVRVALAIVLIPARIVVASVGLVGAGLVSLAGRIGAPR